jgi:putative FmdB family regulatory protein
MPMYPFLCRECGHTFEELVFSSQALDQVRCPECGSDQVTKTLSRVAGLGGTRNGFAPPTSSGGATCSSGGI